MNTKPTPGPWTQAELSPTDVAVGDVMIATAREGLNGISRDEAIANARLMSAAPELLDELKKQAATLADISRALHLIGKPITAEVCAIAERSARAAIAKATI